MLPEHQRRSHWNFLLFDYGSYKDSSSKISNCLLKKLFWKSVPLQQEKCIVVQAENILVYLKYFRSNISRILASVLD